MIRVHNSFSSPVAFEREIAAIARDASGPFSFVEESGLKATYFTRRSRFSGRVIPCVVLAEDYSV